MTRPTPALPPAANRCRDCGRFCGETWEATDSGKMSKRALSLRCPRCTRKGLAPQERKAAR
jgi:hypothetical protein